MKARCKPKRNENGKYIRNGQSQKVGLNRAISDAAWGELKDKTKAVAAKLGHIVVEVDPKYTSQKCYYRWFVGKLRLWSLLFRQKRNNGMPESHRL